MDPDSNLARDSNSNLTRAMSKLHLCSIHLDARIRYSFCFEGRMTYSRPLVFILLFLQVDFALYNLKYFFADDS